MERCREVRFELAVCSRGMGCPTYVRRGATKELTFGRYQQVASPSTIRLQVPFMDTAIIESSDCRYIDNVRSIMIKLLVIDDHTVVREGVKQVLADTPNIEVAGEAANAEEAMRLLRAETWDLALLDIAMPDRSGVELLTQIRREWPELPVLIISMHAENRFALPLMRAGASGYLQKEAMPDEWVRAIQTIAGGRKYITDTLAELLASRPEADKMPHQTLSEREHQIFTALARGESLNAIASELGISTSTVSTYRARVLEKMNMKSNAQIAQYAIHNNLVDC